MFGGGDVEGGMSFATLAAHQTDGFEQPFGKKGKNKIGFKPSPSPLPLLNKKYRIINFVIVNEKHL